MKPLVTAICFLFVVLLACKKSASPTSENGTSRVTIFLTDDPILNVDQLFIDIQAVEVKLEDDGIDSLGGWMPLNVRAGVYDILKFRNGIDTLFAKGDIPANRKIQKLRLTLGSNNSVVIGGHSFPLSLHNNEAQIIVKLQDDDVDASAGETRFWIDFDAGRSIQQKGSSFELRSQLKVFAKSKSGGIEGKVKPTDAKAVVMAINGSDTTTAQPDAEGEFKIRGLVAGTYQLVIHPTANNYKDTTLTVTVRKEDDTNIGTIQLSK